jgi:hypothetical protein
LRRSDATPPVSKIKAMEHQAAHTSNQDCAHCGGRGWKFVILRRSGLRLCDTGQATPQRRQRVRCIHCQPAPHPDGPLAGAAQPR